MSTGQRRPYNSAYRVDASGTVYQRYDKNVLIPFGEYMPGTDLFPSLGRIRGLGRYLPGEGYWTYDSPAARFAFLICYEAILPQMVNRAHELELDLLVNVTYDGWFGPTAAPHQHLLLARAQAAAAGVTVLRATSTGMSAIIDATGQVTEQTELFERATIVSEVAKVRVPSVQSSVGEWSGWLFVAVSVALLLASRGSALPPPAP